MTDARPRRRRRDPADVDAPPHSLECEQGLLGCILLDAACFDDVHGAFPNSGAFFDLRNVRIYEAMLSLRKRGKPIDVMSIQQDLRDDGELEDAGGIVYIADLPGFPSSAAMLPYYLSVVREKAALRACTRTAKDIIARAVEHKGDPATLIEELEKDMKRLLAAARGLDTSTVGPAKTFDQLCAVNTDNDPNCLLGIRPNGTTSRYLCRGGSGWIIGPSGIGKSSLAVMMAALWCAGRPAFGITPTRPMRITIIQAENDDGDMGEMASGVRDGLEGDFTTDERHHELIRQNLKVRTEPSRIGRDFCRWLEKVIRADRADIILLDPFLSFAGIDVSKQEQCSQFLRAWLNPVLQATGAAVLGMHHTGKPKVDTRRKGRPLTAIEQAYEGLGSSELVNWARLVMNIRECGDGIYALSLTKRGNRAWATNPDGSPAFTVWLRQGQGRIWWEQIAPPAESEPEGQGEEGTGHGGKERQLSKPEQVASMNSSSFLQACPEGGEGLREITKRLSNWASSKHAPTKVSISASSARKAVDLMLNSGKLEGRDGLYFKGPNA